MRRLAPIIALALLGAATAPGDDWSEAEVTILRGLWLESLGPPPPDPTNRVADDPRAAELGRLLFNDVRLSANGKVSCASCHDPAKAFTDGEPVGVGVGTGNRRTMPVAPALYSPWQFWDGRADSLWAQALGPIENPVEHGFTRSEAVRVVALHYRDPYRRVFGTEPPDAPEAPASPVGDEAARKRWAALSAAERAAIDSAFVNIAKAIAAFERTQRLPATRFDAYLAGLFGGTRAPPLSRQEREGLRLFIGKGQCTRCHNGPLLTNHGFANTGVPQRPGLPEDRGRIGGVRLARADPFNCRGQFNDAVDKQCDELDFAVEDSPEQVRAYKVPSLRGAVSRPPYMHAGQLTALEAVIDHYNRAPAAPAGTSELEPLGLTDEEKLALVAFLRTLDQPPGAP